MLVWTEAFVYNALNSFVKAAEVSLFHASQLTEIITHDLIQPL